MARVLRSVALLVLLAATSRAADPERVFGFGRMEIYTFKDSTYRLTVQDMNADGLSDVLFINNRDSRLEVLLRRADVPLGDGFPTREQAFRDCGLIVDQQLRAYEAADIDADGKLDLVTFGLPIGLQVRTQKDDGGFAMPERVYLKSKDEVVAVQTGDLNGDGRPDILVCRRDRAEILWNEPDGMFRDRKTIAFAGQNGVWAEIADLDANNTPDLLFFFSEQETPLRARLGNGDGTYGMEHPLEHPPARRVRLLSRAGQTPRLGCVMRNGRVFRTFDFETGPGTALLDAAEVVPRRLALEGIARKGKPAWLVCDFDGDAFDDLLVAAPELSRLHLYSGRADGLDPEPERIDTLSSVDALSRTASGDVLVVSRKEKVLACHPRGDLAAFPDVLDCPGEAVAGTTVGTDDRVLAVCRKDDGTFVLAAAERPGAEMVEHPLDLKNEPNALRAFTLGPARLGVLIFVPYTAPQMVVLEDDDMRALTPADFRVLSDTLEPGQVSLPDAGDGRRLIVSRGRVARVFEWQDGAYRVVRQLNPENEQAEVAGTAPFRSRERGDGVFVYEGQARELIWYPADAAAPAARLHVKNAPAEFVGLRRLANPERDVLVLVGRTELLVLADRSPVPTLVSGSAYTSPSEDPSLQFCRRIHVGAPPAPMIGLVDGANRALELVRETGEDLRGELAFEVYLDAGFSPNGREQAREPRDLASGDVDGDGIGDLALLVHDKLLLYFGH